MTNVSSQQACDPKVKKGNSNVSCRFTGAAPAEEANAATNTTNKETIINFFILFFCKNILCCEPLTANNSFLSLLTHQLFCCSTSHLQYQHCFACLLRINANPAKPSRTIVAGSGTGTGKSGSGISSGSPLYDLDPGFLPPPPVNPARP